MTESPYRVGTRTAMSLVARVPESADALVRGGQRRATLWELCSVPVSKVKEADEITTIDGLRNIGRCGTYSRIRTAIRKGADRM